MLTVEGTAFPLDREGFAYLPPETRFSPRNDGPQEAAVIGLKRPYEPAGLPVPEPIVSGAPRSRKSTTTARRAAPGSTSCPMATCASTWR